MAGVTNKDKSKQTGHQASFSWSAFYAHRKEIRRAFPSVYGLGIRKKLFNVIAEELDRGGQGGDEKILDVGASDRSMIEKIKKKTPAAICKTMDIDRAKEHDYYSVNEINEKFDLIILSEVIEHVEFQEGQALLRGLRTCLKSGGRLVLSTPNLHHPNRYWMDVDHRTPYTYETLGGALRLAGYRVDKIYRTYNDQFIKRFVRLYLMGWLHKYLDVDFAKSIVVVASNGQGKKEGGA